MCPSESRWRSDFAQRSPRLLEFLKRFLARMTRDDFATVKAETLKGGPITDQNLGGVGVRVACELNEIAQAQTRRKESTVFIFVAARVKARVSDKKIPNALLLRGPMRATHRKNFSTAGRRSRD
jgi:hypothetical protein